MKEIELFEKFKIKLIEEYGYDDKDIVLEPRYIMGRSNYIPDIVVYKNEEPYIVIELKSRYMHKEFESVYSQVFEYAKALNSQYFAVASLEFIDAFKIENEEVISIDNIPTKNNQPINKISKELEYLSIIHLFGQMRDILKGGGKRDDYSVLNEINKLLFLKYHLEKNFDSNLGKFNNKYELFEESNHILYEANEKLHIFDEIEKFNLNKDEFNKTFKILQNIDLSYGKNIDYIYFESFIKPLKNETLFSKDLLSFFENLKVESDRLLIANSGFGQLSLSLSFDKIFNIDNNKIKFETNSLLQLLKNKIQSGYFADFLDKDILRNERYRCIFAVPPIGQKTDLYENYEIDYKKRLKDYSLLYIERSYQLLEENGYLYIVLSNNILSNQTYTDARSFVKHHFNILSIISLPIGSLINTNITCSLLILQKSKVIGNSDVLLVEFEKNTASLVNEHIRGELNYPYFINSEVLEDRWDYHYYKQEFLELEYKIKNLSYIYLGDGLKTIRGGNLGNDDNGTVPLIKVSSIEDGKLQENKLGLVSEAKSYENRRGIVYKNDLVVSVVGKYPRCAKVTEEFEEANTNSGVVILRSEDIEFIDYVYEYLNSPIGQMLLHRGISYTSTVPILTQTEIERIPLVLDYKYKDILPEIDYIKTLPFFSYKQKDDNQIDEDECERRIRLRLEEQSEQLKEEYDFKINEEKNKYLSDFELNAEAIMSFFGLKDKIFGVNVIRCFISIKDLKNFKTDKQDFQRDIDDEHKNELINYITSKEENYKFFPEIVLGINEYYNENNDDNLEKELIEEKPIEGSTNLVRLSFMRDEVLNNIEVLDGRHRIESLHESKDIDINGVVSVVFILFDEKQSEKLLDKVIFYNLNKKARQLDPTDYLHLLESDDESDRLKELEILNIDLYKYFKDREYVLYNSKHNYNSLKECINLIDYMEKIYKNDKEYLKKDIRKKRYVRVFKCVKEKLLKDYISDVSLVNKFYKLIVHIMFEERIRVKIIKYLIKEIGGFIEWLKLSQLMDNINKIDDFKNFFTTYQKTNVPKSRNIYISMPYHKETEWTYYVIKDVVNEISNNLQIKIKLIRTDEQTYGVHRGISETVYNDIESCDLMIADLTGDNVNVFNEVGFKMGIDKAQKLNETQIIFLVNTKCFYEEKLENESFIDNEYKVNGKILKNKSKDVPFNLRGIKHIDFHTSHYLKAELYKELEQYFNYYKISKVAK